MDILAFNVLVSIVALGKVCSQDAEYWNKLGQDEIKKALLVRPNENVAKNVILFLGDGLGMSTITAARILKGQLQNKSGEETILEFEKFANVALLKTYNIDRQVSDSAGTATAILSGVKTNYGVVGCNGKAKFKNCESSVGAHIDGIVHWSEKEGKSTGVITTASITHASPSSTYAHSASRYWEGDMAMKNISKKCKDIASQLIDDNNQIEVIFGGGRQWFLPNTVPDPETGKINMKYQRNDSRHLIEEWEQIMRKKGLRYKYVWNSEDFRSINPEQVDHVLGLFGPKHMQYELERDNSTSKTGEPSIKEMTEKAIRILQKNSKGFFLFVEGARIDHAHHDSKAKKALYETLALEEAIKSAVEMTDQSDTLIIVTADHSHVFNIAGYPDRGNDIFGIVKPIGPFERPLDNKSYTALVYANGPGYNQTRIDPKTQALHDNDFVQYGGIPMESETHGGEDVPAYANGPMSHLIQGVKEQNYIAHVMAYASCVGTNKEHCRDFINNGVSSYNHSFMILYLNIVIYILIDNYRVLSF